MSRATRSLWRHARLTGALLAVVVAAGGGVVAVASGAGGGGANVRSESAGSWEGVVLCSRAAGTRSRLIVAETSAGRLRFVTARGLVPAWRRVEVPRGAGAVAVRVLGAAPATVTLRAELVERDASSFDLFERGRPLGCPVSYADNQAAGVAARVLRTRQDTLRLTRADGRLRALGLGSTLAGSTALERRARADIRSFLAALGAGRSRAACVSESSERLALGGVDACVTQLESAKFVYAERLTGFRVTRVSFFRHQSYTWVVACVERRRGGPIRVLARLERGRFRYEGDLEYSMIELW